MLKKRVALDDIFKWAGTKYYCKASAIFLLKLFY